MTRPSRSSPAGDRAPLGAALEAASRPIRIVLGALSGGVSLACAGGFALLALAQPAFQETGPGWLRRLDLSVTFLDRNGAPLGRRGILHDDRVTLDEYPRHLVEAVLATEDRRFFGHLGIDPIGLARATVANARAAEIVQGGSTLTQQLAKNLFLSGERTLDRKIKEAFLAIWLESQLTKREILKLYLDRVYLGAGSFGMEAAARTYFGKSARDVSLPEAAMLGGLLKGPARYSPHHRPVAAASRAAEVLGKMAEAGLITRAEQAAATAAPATVIAAAAAPAPDYALDWAFRDVQHLAASGRLGRSSVLTVETSLDGQLQRHAETTIETALAGEAGRLGARQSAMVVMEPDGAVRAMVGGRDYGESQFNRATDALRQPGSSFKPFVYAAALAGTRLGPASSVVDGPLCIGPWCPANYGRSFSGAMSLSSALARSINTVAVRLSVEIGREAGELTTSRQARFGRARIMELARSMGLTTPLVDAPSLPLGASEVRIIDMARAYAVFANGGFRVEPYAVRAVRTAGGDLLYSRRDGERTRVLGTGIVADMNTMLRAVVETGTAGRAALKPQVVAGKTGTTSAYRDAWFVGYTGHLVGAVWFGNDDGSATRQMTGGTVPAATWRDVMGLAHLGLPPLPLPGRELLASVAEGAGGGFKELAAPKRAFGRTGPEVSAPPGFTVVGGR